MRLFLHLFLFIFLAYPAYADIRFLSISDIHYGEGNSSKNGKDTGDGLLKVAIEEFKQLSQNVDFMITLGDLPTHLLWYSPKKGDYLKTVFHRLYVANTSHKPMFYITGNNDSLGGNYQPFSINHRTPLTFAPDWQGACMYCKGLIIDDTYMRDQGYYSTYVLPHRKDILLIALNSIPFAKIPLFLQRYPHQNRDAETQLQWLGQQLNAHHAKQLLIAMHVPPGKTYNHQASWHEPYLKEFIHLLQKASSHYGQITLLTAHTHMDEIRRIHLDNGKNIYDFATPSISRIHQNYPSMKIFDLNKQLRLYNYTTYYTSSSQRWTHGQHSAIGNKGSIFPHCRGESLISCLNARNPLQICKALKTGLFFGSKSPFVDNNRCLATFSI